MLTLKPQSENGTLVPYISIVKQFICLGHIYRVMKCRETSRKKLQGL